MDNDMDKRSGTVEVDLRIFRRLDRIQRLGRIAPLLQRRNGVALDCRDTRPFPDRNFDPP